MPVIYSGKYFHEKKFRGTLEDLCFNPLVKKDPEIKFPDLLRMILLWYYASEKYLWK